jgi:hypothetical protein
MASEKQVEANRANARKSTGPKTAEGRARSRANAWKHGLTASTLIIVGEEPDEFDELRAALIDSYDPQSPWERELVERLAGIFWRLRRVPFWEAAIIDARYVQLEEEDSNSHRGVWRAANEPEEEDNGEEEEMSAAEWSVYLGRILLRDASIDGLGKLARHEASLVSASIKTLQMLLLLRENGVASRPPVMLEAVALAAPANDA